jgi:hypothetical protein
LPQIVRRCSRLTFGGLFPPFIMLLVFLPKGRNVRDPFDGKTHDGDDDSKTVPIEPLV